MGADVARSLDARRALLLKNHGVVVVGASIEGAVTPATILKAAAEIQLIVEAAGEPAPEFSRDDRKSAKETIAGPEQFATDFSYLTRRLPRAATGAIDSRQVESNPGEFALVAITSLP